MAGAISSSPGARTISADCEPGLSGKLATDYDLALDPAISAQSLGEGMQGGWCDGKALSDTSPGDYVGARRIVNGTDRAQQIAGYARGFEVALAAGADPDGAVKPDPFATPGWLAIIVNIVATIFRRSI
ncbi:hypothetical protein [Paracoccus sp. IB05]|uniref:hypothetical protein n=1 Tax=Paracoccus sp. IB05 TaxID=2779367 RepID=UPI001E599B01|nr:hypothetical protein [Paracoccus sp. IB05]